MPLVSGGFVLFGVMVLPGEYFGSGFFWEMPSLVFPYSAVPWTRFIRQSPWCFGLSHIFYVVVLDPEVDSGQFSARPSHLAVSCGCPGRLRSTRILYSLGDGSRKMLCILRTFLPVDTRSCVNPRCLHGISHILRREDGLLDVSPGHQFNVPVVSGSHLIGDCHAGGVQEYFVCLGGDVTMFPCAALSLVWHWIHAHASVYGGIWFCLDLGYLFASAHGAFDEARIFYEKVDSENVPHQRNAWFDCYNTCVSHGDVLELHGYLGSRGQLLFERNALLDSGHLLCVSLGALEEFTHLRERETRILKLALSCSAASWY